MDDRDEVPEDYEIVGEGRRGRFAALARGGTNLVPVDPDILAHFIDKDIVNGLLRQLMTLVDDPDAVEPQHAARFRDPDREHPALSDANLSYEFFLVKHDDGTFAVKKAENVPQLFIMRSIGDSFIIRTRDGHRSSVEASTIDDAVTFAHRMYPHASIRIELFGDHTTSIDSVQRDHSER